MKFIVAVAALALIAGSASAGSRNVNNNNAEANASNTNTNDIGVSNSIKNRVQAGTPGSFGGGGPCPQYFALGFPGGSLAVGDTCREGKQMMEAGTVDSYFGRKAVRDFICDNNNKTYGLDYCRDRRIKRSGAKQRYDRAQY